MSYSLGADGYFRKHGERFIPVGANWWPGSCGVELWRVWPAEEIQRDLDLLVSLGLNTIRFFLRWQDFEPAPGVYDETAFARLDQLLAWCGERQLAAHPALFVGFMSGGVFWPAWKRGRNLFADVELRHRSAAFARRATQVIVRHAPHVIAIDQGNELCCLADSSQAPPAAVRDWCAAVNHGIRSAWPEAVIISGNEQNQVVNDTGWRFDQQPGCDLLSMHAYPVPSWHSVGFDGMTDPLCQSLLPFYTACARAFAPVMVQEFGTIVTFGARQQSTYLSAMLPACWESGANGFLWWCLRDIPAAVHPYDRNGFESTLGLVDAAGQVKPGLDVFLDFARSLAARPAPAPTLGAVGIYWPREYYHRDNPANAGNEPGRNSRRLILANHLLRSAGRSVRIVRGDQPIPDDLAALVVPSQHLRVDEAEALAVWVEAGGRLLWTGVDPVNWGAAYRRVLGAVPVDYRGASQGRRGEWAGRVWEFTSFPRSMRCDVEVAGAEVLIRDQDGLPLATRFANGHGRVVAVFPCVEDQPAGVADRPAERDVWIGFYAALLDELLTPR